MDEIANMLNLPLFSVRELETSLLNTRKKKKQQRKTTKIPLNANKIEVRTPYYFKSHDRNNKTQRHVCKACSESYRINSQEKHSYLRKKLPLIYPSQSIRKPAQKMNPSPPPLSERKIKNPIFKKANRSNIVRKEIERKINDQFNSLETETIKLFKKKYHVNCYEESVKKIISDFYFQQYVSEREMKNIKVSINQLMKNKKFSEKMSQSYPAQKKISMKKNIKIKTSILNSVQLFDLPKNIFEELKSDKKSLNYRKKLQTLANLQVSEFLRNNIEINSLMVEHMSSAQSSDILEKMKEMSDQLKEFLKGKSDQKEKLDILMKIINSIESFQKQKMPLQAEYIMSNLSKSKHKSKMRKSKHFLSQSSLESDIQCIDNIKNTNISLKQILHEEEKLRSKRKQSRIKVCDNTKNMVELSSQSESEKKMLLPNIEAEISEEQSYSDEEYQEEVSRNIIDKRKKSSEEKNKVRKSILLKDSHRVRNKTHFFQKSKQKLRFNKEPLILKANQLLKQNSELLQGVQKSLKSLNFTNLIIRNTDSVLTKKKKIRLLKQILRKKKDKEELPNKVYHQILSYLEVFQQNCQILMEITKKNEYEFGQIDSSKIGVNLKLTQNLQDMKFFDLSRQYFFGEADEGFYHIYGKTPNSKTPDSEKRRKILLNLIEQEEANHSRSQISDLFQTDVPEITKQEEIGDYKKQYPRKESQKQHLYIVKKHKPQTKNKHRQCLSLQKKSKQISLLLTQERFNWTFVSNK